MVKCPDNLPLLTGTTGKDVMYTLKQWSSVYKECSIPHNGLVDAVNSYNSKETK